MEYRLIGKNKLTVRYGYMVEEIENALNEFFQEFSDEYIIDLINRTEPDFDEDDFPILRIYDKKISQDGLGVQSSLLTWR